MNNLILLICLIILVIVAGIMLGYDCFLVYKVNKKLKAFNEWYKKYKENNNESNTNEH